MFPAGVYSLFRLFKWKWISRGQRQKVITAFSRLFMRGIGSFI